MSAYTFTAPLHHASPKVHTDMLSALRTLLPRSKKPKYQSEEDEELEREKEEMRRSWTPVEATTYLSASANSSCETLPLYTTSEEYAHQVKARVVMVCERLEQRRVIKFDNRLAMGCKSLGF